MKIGAVSEGGNVFVKAKLLLISQCRVWDESRNRFKLWLNKDKEIVRESIGMLRSMAQKQDENGEKARALLRSMRSVKN
jgi:hypothetical protein